MTKPPHVGIAGGGLAGLAAATLLCEAGASVEIFEATRSLGGRAGSFVDPATGELVDHCQHVAMGCCTAFLDFCQRTNVEQHFRRDDVLHFFSREGKRFDVGSASWLPAPLHLAPAMWKLGYLTWREKLAIGKSLWRLARMDEAMQADGNMADWLRSEGQSQQVIDRFWSVVLVSALGESLERASVIAARKVFRDGFLTHRDAYHVLVPQAPLGVIYDEGIASSLEKRGVAIHRSQRIERLEIKDRRVAHIELGDQTHAFDDYLLAVPWHAAAKLLGDESLSQTQSACRSIERSPITSVHLWFDRPIMEIRHAVLVDRLTQWIFAVEDNYYQVVISASHDLAGRSKDALIAEILADLRSVLPDSSLANLERYLIITQPNAVFSYRPELDAIRPSQTTAVENLFLAGDWTATGWPATMESAVRSGYLAAEAIFHRHGLELPSWPQELPRNRLVRRFFGNEFAYPSYFSSSPTL